MNILSGYKTYVAAAGAVGLAVSLAANGKYEAALQTFVGALVACGLRVSVSNLKPILTEILAVVKVILDSMGTDAPPVITPPAEPDKPAPPAQPSNRNAWIAAGTSLAMILGIPAAAITMKPKGEAPIVAPTPLVPPAPVPVPDPKPAPIQPIASQVLPEAVLVEVGTMKDISANVPPGVPYKWIVKKQIGMEFRFSGTDGFVTARAAGSYYVGIAFGHPIDIAWTTVTATGDPCQKPSPIPNPTPEPRPVPNPNPTPTPTPNPTPKPSATKQLKVVVVEHPGTDTSWAAPYMTYQPLVDRMLHNGHAWKIVDKNGKDATGNLSQELGAYATQAQGKLLPWVFLVDQAGTTVYQGPLLKLNPNESPVSGAARVGDDLLSKMIAAGG